MDVKRTAWIGMYGGCLLALTLSARATGAEADDASSMVIISSDESIEIATDEAAVEPAEPSDLAIHVVDDASAAAQSQPEPQVEIGSGDVAVVTSDELVAAPAETSPVIVDADVIPAAHAQQGRSPSFNWNGAFASGPRRPPSSAGIQSQQRGNQYEAAGVVNTGRSLPQANRQTYGDAPPAYEYGDSLPRTIAMPQAKGPAATARANGAATTALAPTGTSLPTLNPTAPPTAVSSPAAVATPVAAATPALQKLKTPLDHAQQQLVSAYQLSLTASTEAEYSQIVQWCASAMRIELDAESRKFAESLSAWALNRRGQTRADEGQADLALADFGAALDSSPENWRAMHNRAVTFAQRGGFAESFDDLCRVIQLNPKFAKAYANRATLYVQAGDLEHALGDYDAALAIDGELLAALVGRGRVCHLLGRLEDALASMDTAVKLAPQDADIVCSRADLLADLGRYEDALLDYAQAIDLNKKFEHAYRNGAWLLATCPDDSIRDVEGALAGAQAALDCGYGERHAALDTMAAALANAGRFDEAVGTIQQAIEIAPEDVQAAYQARQQLYESGQPFRTQPVGAELTAEADIAVEGDVEPSDEAQAAVFIEE